MQENENKDEDIKQLELEAEEVRKESDPLEESFKVFNEDQLRKGLDKKSIEFLTEKEIDYAVSNKSRLFKGLPMAGIDAFEEQRKWLGWGFYSNSWNQVMDEIFEPTQMSVKKDRKGVRQVYSGKYSISVTKGLKRAVLSVYLMMEVPENE